MPTVSDGGGIVASAVSFAYGRSTVVRSASLTLPAGGMVALAGPNGSGKTTLLRLLTGLWKPLTGMVTLDGRPIRSLSVKERARRVTVVSQNSDPHLLFTVSQMVGLGRAPYARFGGASADDRRAVAAALRATSLTDLADRRFQELSGGEQQRAILALALAQETDYLLLDEPTVHLDLHHQHEVLELLRILHSQRGIAILAVMHDLNLAALYFDHLVLMSDGETVAAGPAAEVVHRPDLATIFRAPLRVIPHPSHDVPQVLLNRRD